MFKKLFTLIGVSLLTLTGCGTETDSISTSVSSQNISTFSDSYPERTQVFVNNVSKLGVKLQPEQLKTISLQRHLKTSGKFASRPDANLTSEQNLQVHFDKHKKEFPNVKTKEQYLQSAIDFHNRKSPTIKYYFDTTSFSKGYQSNVVKYDSKTHELSALRSDGDITTYYTSDDPSPKRFVVVEEEFTF
ncbi:MAG: hypothetical protein U0354_04745 [Candidatus Sericytochromatia bacterium]